MRVISILAVAVLLTLFGCKATQKTSHLQLTKSEIRELCSKDNITLSDSLRKRLLDDCKELCLTPEEMKVLKSTGKVILCGECGYILDSKEFKQHEDGKINKKRDSKGFIKGSLRDRIVGPHVD